MGRILGTFTARLLEQPRYLNKGKPFHYPELLARISSLLKRVQRIDESHLLRTDELVVNTLSREVTMGGHLVHLSVKEFQLLATLATEPARVFSKRELLENVWDFRSPGQQNTNRSRLAGTIRPQDAMHLPDPNRQVEVIERTSRSELLDQPDTEHGCTL